MCNVIHCNIIVKAKFISKSLVKEVMTFCLVRYCACIKKNEAQYEWTCENLRILSIIINCKMIFYSVSSSKNYH